jgi:opacity protein-like surface antigen
MRTLLTVLLVLAAVPGAARAQTPTGRVARGDVSASIGWFIADRPVTNACCPWSSGLFKGLQGGYYWTDHLKTEVEIAASGETETYSYSQVGTGSSAVYSSNRHAFRDVLVSGTQAYQFGRNSYFHPFVAAGVDVAREQHTIERTAVIGTGRNITTSSDTRVLARPFVVAGFKAYGSERMFFRTELKAGYRNGLDQITWKLGFGIDF